MFDEITLSDAAFALLVLHIEREGVDVTPRNRHAYRELARAGIMSAVSTFTRGPESRFRFTEEGWNRRGELLCGCGAPG